MATIEGQTCAPASCMRCGIRNKSLCSAMTTQELWALSSISRHKTYAPGQTIVTEGDTLARQASDHVLEVPAAPELLAPILEVVPLQLLAYHIAVRRGCDVDQPRNLAKSVTVE